VARSLAERLGARTAVAAVYLTSAALIAAAAWVRRQPLLDLRAQPRAYLLGCGSLFVFYTFALYQALGLAADRVQVLELGMLNYTWPTLTVVFSTVLLRRRAAWLLWPGTLLSLGGVFLVLSHQERLSWRLTRANLAANPLAYGLALGAGVSWALYSTLTRRWAAPGARGAVFAFVAATGVLMLAVRLFAAEASVWSWQATGELLFLGSSTAAAYACWEVAMRRADVTLVATISYLTPLLSTLASCAYLRVMPGARLWFGCGTLVVGSLLSWRALAAAGERPLP